MGKLQKGGEFCCEYITEVDCRPETVIPLFGYDQGKIAQENTMKTRTVIILCWLALLLAGCQSPPGLQGRITDQNGHPLEGISVSVGDPASTEVSFVWATTDAKGEYHLEDLATGKYTLYVTWDLDPTCPTMSGGGIEAVQRIDSFVAMYVSNGYANAFKAFTTIDYVHGQGMRFNLKIPCSGEAPGLQPTIPASFYFTATATQPLPGTVLLQPTDAESTALPTATDFPCPTTVPETATAFADLGAGDTTPSIDLTGTSWAVIDSAGRTYDLEFMVDGRLEISQTDPNPNRLPCSIWRQAGEAVYLNVFSGSSTWDGRIDGNTMQGSAQNYSGSSWTWTATRR
jgi:hypothetical protein